MRLNRVCSLSKRRSLGFGWVERSFRASPVCADPPASEFRAISGGVRLRQHHTHLQDH